MSESKSRSDEDANEAIKRVERQMRIEGKLDQSMAVEGAAMLFAPLVLGVFYVVGSTVKAAGFDGTTMVILSVAAVFALAGLAVCLIDRK